MNKKIIALAIAGAFVAPAAFAQDSSVKIYGQANASMDSVSLGNGNGTVGNTGQGARVSRVSSNDSYFGLKGSEDLGGGSAAIFQIESTIDLTGGNGGTNTLASGPTPAAANGSVLANRNTFIGLSSSSTGTVLFGRHDTPYKMATRGLDVFDSTIGDNRTLMGRGGINFDSRENSVVAYVSPSMNGFTGVAAIVNAAENATQSSIAGVAQSKGSAYSLAGLYSNGPLTANLAYENHKLGTAGTGIAGLAAGLAPAALSVGSSEKAWKLGVGYTMNALTINGVYEKTSDSFGASNANLMGHSAYYLAGKYAVTSAGAVNLAYTRAGNAGAAGVNNGAKQWSLGYDHNLSKRTSVYALYTSLSNDTNATYALGNFQDGPSTIAGGNPAGFAGAKTSAISLGMKHAF